MCNHVDTERLVKVETKVEAFENHMNQRLDKIDERGGVIFKKLDTIIGSQGDEQKERQGLEVRVTRLEERWKAAAVIATFAIGLLSFIAPVIHKLLGI